MYTSMIAVTVAGMMASATTREAGFRDDYKSARQAVLSESKPMVVFLTKGKAADFGADAKGVLAKDYVAVAVNTETAEGQKLARAFDMTSGTGVVISDRTGTLQAFRHEGNLSAEELKARLTRYSDADHVVRTTETVAGASEYLAYAGGSCAGGSCGTGYAYGYSTGGCSTGTCYSGSCSGGSCHSGSTCGSCGSSCGSGRSCGHSRGGRCGRGCR
jgi:hypothetical protein